MRLKSLEISNFRVIKTLRLNLPDRIIGIIGPNGAGKSSIIEAISWALYGNQASRTGREEIKSTFAGASEPCRVVLDFSINGSDYRVDRRLVGKNERAEVELYRDEQSESVGVNETARTIQQLLGLDWKGFLTSFLARQQELNALSDLPPSRRRDYLAGMLGIERLDRAIQKSKDDARLLREKVTWLERQGLEIEEVDKQILTLTERFGHTEPAAKKASDEMKKAESKVKQSTAAYEALAKRQTAWYELSGKIETSKATTANLKTSLEQAQSDLKELQGEQSRLEPMQAQLAPLEGLKKRQAELAALKSQSKLRLELSKELELCLQELTKVDRDRSNLEKQMKEAGAGLSEIPEDIFELWEQSKVRLEKARQEYTEIKATNKALATELEKIDRQMASIESLGPQSVCDRCHRPLGDDLPGIRKHLAEERSGIESRNNAAGRELEAVSQKGKELGATLQKLESQKDRRGKLVVEQRSLVESEKNLSARAKDLQLRQKRLNGQIERMSSEKFDEKLYDKILIEIESLEKLRQQADQISGRLKRLPNVQKSIARFGDQIKRSDEDLSKLKERLKENEFDNEAFASAKREFELQQKNLSTWREQYAAAAKESEMLKSQLEEMLRRKENLKKTAEELEQTRSAHYHGEKLTTLFGQFRHHVIAGIRPALSDLSSQLLSEMTGGKYSMVELDENYNLSIMAYGQFFKVDRFSGGEKDLANLCLRMAISQALTESAGLDRSFVILDEVFGSQDSDRRDLILQALKKLDKSFPQILLVTHMEEIKDKVEELVEVVPTAGGWSEVRVNGSLA